MKAKIRSLAWSCLALLCGAASAQIRDGAYTGTLECGPLITNPQQGAWKQPININVTGQSVTWERPDPRITEVGSSTLRDRRVSFALEGRWNPGQRNSGKWRNVVMLEWKDSVLSGPATIFSADGDQRLRDCSVRVAMAGSDGATAGVSSRTVPSAASTPQVHSGLADAAAAAKWATALPPVPGSAPAAERARREQDANREKDALRERAIRENEERIARQREAQRREDEQAQRQAQERRDAQRRSQEAWEQQQQAAERQREADRKAKEEQERQRQVAAKQQQEREAQERAAANAKQEAHAKGAASRQTERIKALGVPSSLANATLYVNYMGQWTVLMPCNQWLGLLLENSLIASVQSASVRGFPGISVKRTGHPAVTFLFRVEGSEAYIHALVADGKAEPIRTPSDHSQVALMMRVLTDEKSMR